MMSKKLFLQAVGKFVCGLVLFGALLFVPAKNTKVIHRSGKPEGREQTEPKLRKPLLRNEITVFRRYKVL